MLYERKTFTVPATSGRDEDRRAFCAEKGHSAPDSKGRCLCCGETIGEPHRDTTARVHRALRLDASARVGR